MALDFIERAVPWPKGRLFEDFTDGQRFQHHWGRTITEADTILFSTLTLSFNHSTSTARTPAHSGTPTSSSIRSWCSI